MGTVVTFPGQPLVAVLSRDGWHGVMLAKIGEKNAALQVSYPTLAEAVREARDGAALCGWRYVGVFDDRRLAGIEAHCSSSRQPPHLSTGPDAA